MMMLMVRSHAVLFIRVVVVAAVVLGVIVIVVSFKLQDTGDTLHETTGFR